MYSRILVALDGSPSARRALDEAIGLAAESKGTLIAACVVEHPKRLVDPVLGFVEEIAVPESTQLATATLEAARGACAARGIPCVERALDAFGEGVASVLVRTAGAYEADLIVMGTRGLHGMRRLLIGSTAEEVLRTADCPVLVVRQEPETVPAPAPLFPS